MHASVAILDSYLVEGELGSCRLSDLRPPGILGSSWTSKFFKPWPFPDENEWSWQVHQGSETEGSQFLFRRTCLCRDFFLYSFYKLTVDSAVSPNHTSYRQIAFNRNICGSKKQTRNYSASHQYWCKFSTQVTDDNRQKLWQDPELGAPSSWEIHLSSSDIPTSFISVLVRSCVNRDKISQIQDPCRFLTSYTLWEVMILSCFITDIVKILCKNAEVFSKESLVIPHKILSRKDSNLGKMMKLKSGQDPSRKHHSFLTRSLFSILLRSCCVSWITPCRIRYSSLGKGSCAVSLGSWDES